MWHRITDRVREKMEPARERRESGGRGSGGGGWGSRRSEKKTSRVEVIDHD